MKYSIILALIVTSISCTVGKLRVIADLPQSLKETSAIEMIDGSDLMWVIEDAGNKNNLYGLNADGKIIKDINIDNVQNIDWEDLTSDDEGNIYIGDFGNNNKKRKNFAIYKVNRPYQQSESTNAEVITFSLPKDMKSYDFESFFLHENHFYLFSKTEKKSKLFKVPNIIGDHVAEFISEFKFKGKHTRITSADISDDGSTVVLLNHNKLWKLTNYDSDDFFDSTMEKITFDHTSQKEGIYMINTKTVLITDEKTKGEGGNIYRFPLN